MAAGSVILVLALALAGPASPGWQALGDFRVTAYCPCVKCCGKSDGITADGTHAPSAKERIVAGSKQFPFGTRLWIEGVGEVVVHDRGSKVKGHRLELFFPRHREALQWGVQQRKVYRWNNGGP